VRIRFLLEEQGAAKQHRREGPVEHRRLPLDEGLVMQRQSHTAEDRDDHQADPQHGVDLAASEPQPADLRKGGRHGNASRRVDAGKLVGYKEKDDGKKIEKELHDRRRGQISRLWPISRGAVHARWAHPYHPSLLM